MEKSVQNKPQLSKTAHIRGFEEGWVPHPENWGIDKSLFTSETSVNQGDLYKVVKKSPEVVGCISAIVEDIMADGWEFETNKRSSGKKTVEDARKFQIKSKFYKVITNALWELMMTGNSYILKLSVDVERIKSVISRLTKTLAKTHNVKLEEKKAFEFIKQDFEKPQDLQLLKSSTVRINFDETGEISSYQQTVRGKVRVYKSEDIIHLTLNNIGGQPYGFTPLEPLLSDIATLIFAKEFAGKYFENDGVPYFLFNLPEASPNDRNYKLLKKELKELKKKANKYRTLVTTGNITAEQINKFNKDMEFTKLIRHFTQIVLIAFGVPAHRINLTLEQKSGGAELGKIESGYYKKIAFMQKALENDLNRDLWSAFGVRMVFNRAYKIDEIREAEVIRILSEIGAITIEEARKKIGMSAELPDGHPAESIGSDKRINMEQDSRRQSGQEEKEDKMDNKLKSFDGAIEISLERFIRVVELKLGAENFDQANILYIETPQEFILYFHDGNWKYKSRIDKSKINIERFRVEMLRNATKVII